VAPLLNATEYPAPWRALTLSLASRIEGYSDFGTAVTPRLGLTWEPLSHLALRTTWAKSVRVPNLEDLVESNNLSFVRSLGGTPALIWTGGNARLSVERALTRTIGLRFKSDDVVPRFTGDVSYFDILFRGRIQPSAFPPDILTDPAYASFVIHNPSASAREGVCSGSIYLSGIEGNCLKVPVDAIVDLRERNTATLWTDGIDAQFGMSFETSLGELEFRLASTYIFDYKQANAPDAPLVSFLNTESNPLALHVIGNTTWKIGDAEASLNLRYANGYRNIETQPVSRIASWTTADLRLAYTFSAMGTPGSHPTEVALSCENLFNRYSPFAINNVANLAYDQENGDLTGRVITLAVDVKW
jgi:iron complex outermembrane receptor protein